MKKIGMVGVALAAVMAAGTLAACGGPKGSYDMEKDPFVMGIQTPDGVFNPFFSTSVYDSNIISWTQIGMLNTDKNGNIVCGDNEMCAVKNYATKYDMNEAHDDPNDAEHVGVTTYQFAIKNGIKFSDGTDLTIKDVLFNLYVYLDINYTGSSTIYSTKIEGLEQYRMNDPGALTTAGASEQFEERFLNAAETRILHLQDYVRDYYKSINNADRAHPDTYESYWAEHAADAQQAKADFGVVKSKFRDELNSDWNNVVAGMENYRKQQFTEAWQVFLWQDGGDDFWKKKAGGTTPEKDADGNYIFDPTCQAVSDRTEELEEYLGENEGDKDELTKQWAIETVFNGYFPVPLRDDPDNVQNQIAEVDPSKLSRVVNFSASAETIRTQFANEEKEAYFDKQGERLVKTISGITTFKADKIVGDSGEIALGETCDILQIKIRGVDPKAIYNFSFLVAPLNYYSGTLDGKDYIADFNGDVASNPATAGTVDDVCFGLKPASTEFMEKVVNAPEKIGLPKGAGPYKASKNGGGDAANDGQFFSNNHVYYERNTYFHTVGKGLNDAKIRYMQYSVVPADQYITNLQAQEIDFADPSASKENKDRVDGLKNKGISSETIDTAGYGYIGLNPRYVPNINIRRAIIKALNPTVIFNNYYPNNLASRIYRSMSKANWAYPEGATEYAAKRGVTSGVEGGWNGSYSYDPTGETIEAIVRAEGYTKGSDGVYQKNLKGFGIDKLDYTFTIAGSSTDHPAYTMLLRARDLLNAHGFNVKVTTSQTALSDLTTGKLAVWAAAWTSTVDPDMYQVYHKDSKATSVNNWGYPQIKQNPQGLYNVEQGIVAELSEFIEDGRATDNQDERKAIYASALDLVMELAVEFPTYQRVDLFAFNSNKLKRSTMPAKADLGPYNSLLARIWEIEYNG